MRIALDGMGSDNQPAPEIEGAVLAAREFGCQLLITGDEAILKAELQKYPHQDVLDKITFVHAPEKIAMSDKPAFAARKKSNNSVSRGMQLVKDGDADAMVTVGNTGAALTSGLFILRRIKGVKRPALTVLLPSDIGLRVLLDAGANAECKPEFLKQFGIMGSVYAEKVLGIDNPRVALLSNGEEEGKGNDLTIAAYPLLQNSNLNFIGNVEGKEVFAGETDVTVTDGFTGNIVIKVGEAIAKLMRTRIKTALKSSPKTMLGGMLVQSSIRGAFTDMDPDEIGGVILLGLNAPLIIGHGRSNAKAIKNAIGAAIKVVETDVVGSIRTSIAAELAS